MRTLRAIGWCLALLSAVTAQARVRVVLIGGTSPHNPNVHDSPGVIARLAAALRASPDAREIEVCEYPDGWPADPHALDGATAVVWHFDGLERHPLLDAGRAAVFAKAMARRTGLVALHQSFTLPAEARGVPLERWLGAARYGMVDRIVAPVTLTPARHPIGNGVGRIAYRDEFYPSLRFSPRGVTPVLRTMLTTEAAPNAMPTPRTVAWAYARPGGGRSFGFSGVHYLDTLDNPALRRLLLNAIFWTARMPVPTGGVR